MFTGRAKYVLVHTPFLFSESSTSFADKLCVFHLVVFGIMEKLIFVFLNLKISGKWEPTAIERILNMIIKKLWFLFISEALENVEKSRLCDGEKSITHCVGEISPHASLRFLASGKIFMKLNI